MLSKSDFNKAILCTDILECSQLDNALYVTPLGEVSPLIMTPYFLQQLLLLSIRYGMVSEKVWRQCTKEYYKE